jgi:hypothetical protein
LVIAPCLSTDDRGQALTAVRCSLQWSGSDHDGGRKKQPLLDGFSRANRAIRLAQPRFGDQRGCQGEKAGDDGMCAGAGRLHRGEAVLIAGMAIARIMKF